VTLIELAKAGDADAVLRELMALTPPQRAAEADALAARTQAMAADRNRYSKEQHRAQYVAELGCQVTPEAAAGWLVQHQVLCFSPYYAYLEYGRALQVLDLYPADWRAEVVAGFAGSREVHALWFPLAEHIICSTGCPVPATAAFVTAWLEDRKDPPARPAGMLGGVTGSTVLDRLRADDLTPILLPAALAPTRTATTNWPNSVRMDMGGYEFTPKADSRPERQRKLARYLADSVLGAVMTLCNEGAAGDRAGMLGWLLNHVQANFMGSETVPTIDWLRALAPTPAELTPYAGRLLSLLRRYRDKPAVSGWVREALVDADKAGLLTAADLATVSEPLLDGRPLDLDDYWMAAFASRLAAGKGIDRGDLIPRALSCLRHPGRAPQATTALIAALDLTPAEHAAAAGDLLRFAGAAVTGLLQEDDGRAIAATLQLLRALDLTPVENARFTREYLAFLDRPSSVAGHAQQELLALDDAGLLDAGTFEEMCQRILLRPEKKLVTAQLAALSRAATRDPARAPQAVAAAATAFSHPDLLVQEKALGVVTRHLGAAGDAVLPGLRDAAALLSPTINAQAATLLGTEEPAGETREMLPAVPGPRPVPGPAATAAEVAQEVAAVIAGDQDVTAFERALDGLVRHARADRAALARALTPVTRRKHEAGEDCQQSDIYDVALAVRGKEPRPGAIQLSEENTSTSSYFSLSRPGAMLAARLIEAIGIIESGTQPFLLAVPTFATGALDAGVLAGRIAELEALGLEPAPVDLAQALLRTAPGKDPEALRAAGELRSEAGRRLAAWLRDGGLPHQDSEPEHWYQAESGEMLYPVRPDVALGPSFPGVAADLVRPRPVNRGDRDWPPAPYWVAQLPHHRDAVAARDCGFIYYTQRLASLLPVIAEADGPAGYAVHIAIAQAMWHGAQAGVAAADALLVLAARGHLDSDLLGRQLETVLRLRHTSKGIAESLRAAAETGAHGTVWAVLKAALPGLLRGTPAKGAADIIALAAECASQCGASGEIPEVTEVAGRGGSTRAVLSARLLRDALRQA